MAEATAFVIANFTIHDADTYRIYEKGFFPILKKHGGTFHTYDDNNANLEGDAPPEDRRAGTKLNFLTIVHGLPPRS